MAKVGALKITVTFWAIAYLLVFASKAFPDILQVPKDYLTIQEAVDASKSGDTVVVASGIYRLYSGNITIAEQSVTLKSAHGAEKTVIEGRGNSPVISLVEDSRAVIDGFTITRIADADSSALKGGGVYCPPSSSPTIINNIITGNRAVFGAGVYCGTASSPAIMNNVISKNRATGSGGGIFCYKSSPDIGNNRIKENEAATAGGGIYCYKGTPNMTNNNIWKNQAKSGGGISSDRSSCTSINNTITKNHAVYGGGIFFEGGSIRIINNILWDNEDDLYSEEFSPATRPDHSDIGDGDFRGLNGNISADPLFMQPDNGDFRLGPDSPCVNTGNPDPIYRDPDGSRNDMGAYGGPGATIGGKLQ